MPNEVLRISHLSKSVSGFLALRDVHLNLYAGECHGVLIHNDLARKTLTDLLVGKLRPDTGSLWVFDRPTAFQGVEQANRAGIYSVRAQSQLIPNFSIAENLFFTNPAYYQRGFQNRKLMRYMAAELISETGLPGLHPDQPAYTLRPPEAHLVEILKAYSLGPRILYLDALFDQYTQRHFDSLIRLLQQRPANCTVCFLTKRYVELYRAAQRITVFRKSSTAITLRQRTPPSREELYHYQASHEPPVSSITPRLRSDQRVFRAEHLTSGSLQGVSFDLCQGEILGLVDEDGMKYEQLARVLTGSVSYEGQMYLRGRPITLSSRKQADRLGVSLIRASDESVLLHNMTLTENITLTMQGPVYGPLGLSRRHVQAFAAREALADLHAEELWQYARHFERLPELPRNMEFIIRLARRLCNQTQILFLVNPHLHFDDLSIESFPGLMDYLRRNGMSIVIISIQQEQVQQVCDRIHYLG